MRRLQDIYHKGLLDHLVTLETARSNLASGDNSVVDEIYRVASLLRSSGTTYGFPEITASAEKLLAAADADLLHEVEQIEQLIREVCDRVHAATECIIVIDNDPMITELLKVQLTGPGREVQTANSIAGGRDLIAAQVPTLIILDVMLHDGDGRSLLSLLRAETETANVPIIVLSGNNNDQIRIECLSKGANVVEDKPFDPVAFASRVKVLLHGSKQAVEGKAIDTLTQLLDRNALLSLAHDAILTASHKKQPLTLAIIELNELRSINNRLGHQIGDRILQHVAELMIGKLRQTDRIARWAGDQFAVLLPNTMIEDDMAAIEKIRSAVTDNPLELSDGKHLDISLTVGLTDITGLSSIENVVQQCDAALSQARSGTRTRTPMGALPVQQRNILLVDDDQLIATIIRHRLERVGFKIHHFENGADALQQAEETPFALIILDVKVPGMDGFEMLQRLRRSPEHAGTPIVMLTSMGSNRDVKRGFECGADDYIVKPFSSTELMARIRRLLQRRSQQPDAPPDIKMDKPPQPPEQPTRILVADGDPARVENISDALSEIGNFEISEVGSGVEVLQRAMAEIFDAVILSTTLPDMDGTTVFQQLRNNPGTRVVRVILAIETSETANMAELLALGAEGIISKPVSAHRLANDIGIMLELV